MSPGKKPRQVILQWPRNEGLSTQEVLQSFYCSGLFSPHMHSSLCLNKSCLFFIRIFQEEEGGKVLLMRQGFFFFRCLLWIPFIIIIIFIFYIFFLAPRGWLGFFSTPQPPPPPPRFFWLFPHLAMASPEKMLLPGPAALLCCLCSLLLPGKCRQGRGGRWAT